MVSKGERRSADDPDLQAVFHATVFISMIGIVIRCVI
jgi:hypothetical protein